jgi:hypothetical protein
MPVYFTQSSRVSAASAYSPTSMRASLVQALGKRFGQVVASVSMMDE